MLRTELPHALPGGHAAALELAHGALGVPEHDEVVLNVLAGGDVTEAAGVFRRHISQRAHLLASDDALGILMRIICTPS
jgi:hypothetical protein